jgi:hypothetical protein
MSVPKKKTQRARLQRPSPTAHAAEHPGEIKKGHDGKRWRSEPDKNGVFHWKRVKGPPSVRAHVEAARSVMRSGLGRRHVCHTCKKPINGQPISHHSKGKPSKHYHASHAPAHHAHKTPVLTAAERALLRELRPGGTFGPEDAKRLASILFGAAKKGSASESERKGFVRLAKKIQAGARLS